MALVYGKELTRWEIIKNCGFDSKPLMLLYHCNFGYPLLSSGLKGQSSNIINL